MQRRAKAKALEPWALRADKRMRELGKTRTDLAELWDVSDQTVGKKFRKEVGLSLLEACQLADFLKVSMQDLFPEHITREGQVHLLPLLEHDEIQPWLAGELTAEQLPAERFLRGALDTPGDAVLNNRSFRFRPGVTAILLSPGILPTDILQVIPCEKASSSARPFLSWATAGTLVVHHQVPEPGFLGVKARAVSLIPGQEVPPIKQPLGEVVAQHRSYT